MGAALVILALGVAASAALAAAGARQRPSQAAPPVLTGRVAGVVVDVAAGHPVDGVRVRLSGDGLRGSRTAVTDDDGQFSFPELPAGRFTLTASKAGYVDIIYGQKEPGNGRSGTAIDLFAGQQMKDLQVAIPRGGVITGTVFDEKGRPAVGTPVRASRWSMQTGERRLVSAETASSDDRGIYRIYGLAPGSYVVSAIPRNVAVTAVQIMTPAQAGAVATAGGQFTVSIRQGAAAAPASADESGSGYAPVYYPGTLDLAVAMSVDVGVSELRSGIDLRLERVPLTRVEGSVMIPPDVRMSNIRVRLVNTTVRAPGVSTPSARADRDGRFVFNGVAPGQYRAVAVVSVRNPPPHAIGALLEGQPLPRGNTSVRFWAFADVNVFGQEVPPVSLVMRPGMAVSGQVIFDGAAPPADQRRVRLSLAPVGQFAAATGATSASTNLGADGRFRFLGVVPGTYRIRASSGAGSWFPKSAVLAGRDTLDFPFELSTHENVSGLMFTLTNRRAALNGALLDALSRPTADYTVVLFPADPQYWLPQARRIKAARPSTDGRFVFGDLPAGNYRLGAVTHAEPGAWYDPQFLQQLFGASVAVSLTEGEAKTQTLRIGR
jgi:hypothetical protein